MAARHCNRHYCSARSRAFYKCVTSTSGSYRPKILRKMFNPGCTSGDDVWYSGKGGKRLTWFFGYTSKRSCRLAGGVNFSICSCHNRLAIESSRIRNMERSLDGALPQELLEWELVVQNLIWYSLHCLTHPTSPPSLFVLHLSEIPDQ